MLHSNRKGIVRRKDGLILAVLAMVLALSACKTAPETPPTPESLPLPEDSALYLFLSPRERDDLAYRLLDSFDIGTAMAGRIEIVGVAVAQESAAAGGAAPGTTAGEGLFGSREVVVAVRGNLPTRRLRRALRRSDDWSQGTDSRGREYFRQAEGPMILTLPSEGVLILGNGEPEALPTEPPLVSPWPGDFVARFADVPVAAYLPSPGGGAVSTPLGGVLPLTELRFYVEDAGDDEPGAEGAAADEAGPDEAGRGTSEAAGPGAASSRVNLFGEAVLDTERSARAFEAILRILALGIASEMQMEPGRMRELLTVSQNENIVSFAAGPLETTQFMNLSSELLEGYGGTTELFGGAP